MEEERDKREWLAIKRTMFARERNRLANERTFLAWTRTGLACVAGGLAIIKLLSFQNPHYQFLSQLLGGVLVLLGDIFFIMSLIDYIKSYKKSKMITGYIGSIGSIASISFVLVFVSLSLLLIAFF